MRLGVDTRDFHGDIVDVRLFESFNSVLIPAVGLFITEHDLTEEVDVLTDVLMVALGEVLRQCRAGSIEDDTRGIGTQTVLDDRNGDRIEISIRSKQNGNYFIKMCAIRFTGAIIRRDGTSTLN